jgi:uncharacterized protein (DUF433 family)
MALAATRYEHIVLDDSGVPIIADTNTKVVEIIVEQMAYGWSAEEIHFQHPHLTLGQIYSALAYYWDHGDELNRDIERRLEHADCIQQSSVPPQLIAKLKAKGLK